MLSVTAVMVSLLDVTFFVLCSNYLGVIGGCLLVYLDSLLACFTAILLVALNISTGLVW